MVNYSFGKIYKIQPQCPHEEGEIYIGSTAQLSLCLRYQGHKYDYLNKNKNLSVHPIFDKYGYENCNIVLLENCPCETRDELFAREAHYIQTLKCVNQHIMGRTRKQYRDEHKEERACYDANLRNGEETRERILQQKRDYHHEHKEIIKEKRAVYMEQNREKVNANRRITVTCECGCVVNKYTMQRHLTTKKHEDIMRDLIQK
jgi:hypothetical protein